MEDKSGRQDGAGRAQEGLPRTGGGHGRHPMPRAPPISGPQGPRSSSSPWKVCPGLEGDMATTPCPEPSNFRSPGAREQFQSLSSRGLRHLLF